MTALQWMQKEAKVIQRQHPRMKWTDVMKKAGAAYRAKHKPAKKVAGAKKIGAYKVIERGEKRSTRSDKIYQVNRSKKGTFRGTARINGVERDYTLAKIQPNLNFLKTNIVAVIGNLEGKKLLARTKTEKNKIQKTITEHKQKLKKITDAIEIGKKKKR